MINTIISSCTINIIIFHYHIVCFQDLVRETLSSVLGTVFDRTSVEVETQEDTPRNGDLTVRVHIRGSSVRYINSGALSRINFISDGLNRSERTLQILEVKIFITQMIYSHDRYSGIFCTFS